MDFDALNPAFRDEEAFIDDILDVEEFWEEEFEDRYEDFALEEDYFDSEYYEEEEVLYMK